jgi:hypothetical protein
MYEVQIKARHNLVNLLIQFGIKKKVPMKTLTRKKNCTYDNINPYPANVENIVSSY